MPSRRLPTILLGTAFALAASLAAAGGALADPRPGTNPPLEADVDVACDDGSISCRIQYDYFTRGPCEINEGLCY